MFFVFLFISLTLFWIYKSTRKPDKFPPGPPNLPVIGGLLGFLKKGSLLQSNRHLVEKYGEVCGVFFGRQPAVFIAEYNLLKELFKKDELSNRPPMKPVNEVRPGWQTVDDDEETGGFPPGVISSNGHYWRDLRRFLLKNLKEFGFGKASMESIIQEEMSKVCSKLSKFPEGEPIDLNRTMNISILNSLWSILVGERLEHDDPTSIKLVLMFDKFVKENDGPVSPIVFMLPHPSMAKWPVLRKIFGFDMAQETFKAAEDFIQIYIDEHKRTLDPDNIRDFMDLMLLEIENTTDKDSSFYGERGFYAMFNVLIDLFVAGMETTASSLLWSILYLIHHPDIQKKVHQELDEVVGRNRFPSLDDRPKLHMVNAVLLESFRTATVVVAGVPHCASADVTIKHKSNEYIIPKGSIVFGSLHHIMYDETHFKDPYTFTPGRFLDQNGQFQGDERVIPFSIGKRVCLGQTLADKEYFLFFVGLMQQFEFNHAPGTNLPSYRADESCPRALFRPPPPFKVLLKHRLKM